MSYDGTGFRRRSASGIWTQTNIELGDEDPAFYEPSDEYRCASSGAAAIFFSLLAEEAAGTPGAAAAEARAAEIFDAFAERFFDASACRFRREGGGSKPSYWRAVDQAMGCLACLRMARVGHKTAASRAMAQHARPQKRVPVAAHTHLLCPHSFFSPPPPANTLVTAGGGAGVW